MDLDRMLAKCLRDQWRVGELDWSRPPPALSADDEQAIVQYFTDMAAIERLAGALFVEQGRHARDPRLRAIFESFVVDELRHSHVAQMLADHYDVNHLRQYRVNPALQRFAPHFVYAIRFLSAEMANVYITTGELILDVALLRSLSDYVDDPMCDEAMARINQDESRHIAIDFHMVEYYASDEYESVLRAADRLPVREQLRAWWAFAMVLRYARPFFREVFFRPMDRCDPSGRRIREAFKRIQLLSSKESVRRRPISRFLLTLQAIHNHRVLGRVLGGAMVRLLGVDPEVLPTLYTPDEFRRAATMSFDQMAEEALAAKAAG